MKATIILVDDDEDLVLSTSKALKQHGIVARINGVTRAESVLENIKKLHPEVVVLDLCLNIKEGTNSGFNLLKRIKTIDKTCQVIILTGHGGLEHGIKALQLGATNFLEKPTEIQHLKALINDAISQSQLKRAYLEMLKEKNQEIISNKMVGSSQAILKVIDAIKFAAQTPQPVLISGETGTGKGVCAQLIHQLSPRKKNNFIRFQPHFGNADMVHSDLFGHLAGSFTGAGHERAGLLQEANFGTFFLDEVDETPIATQIALLGVLQEKKFRPIGSDKTIDINLRLITATNQDIEESLEKGKIRQDFYHRIAHFKINIPPLRERKEDIPCLIESFIKKFREDNQLNVFSISSKTLDYLTNYNWPGNIRELESVIEGGVFHAHYLGHTIIDIDDITTDKNAFETSTTENNFQAQVKAFKKNLIKKTLNQCQGNQIQAANVLGINRTTLRRTLNS